MQFFLLYAFRKQCFELCIGIRELIAILIISDNHFMCKNNSWPQCFMSIHSLKKKVSTEQWFPYTLPCFLLSFRGYFSSLHSHLSILYFEERKSVAFSQLWMFSWVQPENQHIRAAPGELCKSFSASSFFNKNQNNPPDFRYIISILPDFTHTNLLQCFNCWLSSQH